jgi:hypothetical protein
MGIAGLEKMQEFLASWTEDPLQTKDAFTEFLAFLSAQEDVECSFKARPGVSYSLRAGHPAQEKREFFVLVDVVDDDPQHRWLSVCFYNDMVTDPDELGDFVPDGLMGEDALCFNLDGEDAPMRAYIGARLAEAARHAGVKAE